MDESEPAERRRSRTPRADFTIERPLLSTDYKRRAWHRVESFLVGAGERNRHAVLTSPAIEDGRSRSSCRCYASGKCDGAAKA